MFISLKIKNFRSIKDELILDNTKSFKNNLLELSNNSFRVNNIDLLKSMILYGRNAAGKSNILWAFRAIQFLVRKSDSFKHEESLAPYEQFIFEKSILGEPVEFDIEFIGENKIKYLYTIKYIQKKIIYESLSFYPKGVISKLFVRDNNNITYGEYYEGVKKDIEKDLLENQLFLSKSASKKIPYLKEAYLFITEYLTVSTLHAESYERALINSACDMMSKNNLIKENMMILLKEADTNIIDFVVNKINEDIVKFPENMPEDLKKQIMKDFMYSVLTKHNDFNNGLKVGIKDIPLEFESLGTKKLMAVGGLIINKLLTGGLLVIDELDKSLHPLLTKMLINLFHSKKNNPKNAQLIIATHDSSLLDSSIFGRDQICFVDKKFEGNSFIYKLSEIKGVRKDIPFEKWYMSGRFSAIPVLGDIQLKIK